MKLITYRYAGEEVPGILSVDEKRVFPFSVFGLAFEDMNGVIQGLSDKMRDEIAQKLPQTDPAQGISLEEVELQAPVPCPRQDLICLGDQLIQIRPVFDLPGHQLYGPCRRSGEVFQ